MVLVVCTYCGGSGQYQGIGTETCWKCCGTGRDMNSDCWAFPCPECNGSGTLPFCRFYTCGQCGGSGYKEQ